MNLTGSPTYPARIVITGDPGSGCSSDDQYRQFNTGGFTGPQVGSVGLESGVNYMVGCPDHTVDLALQRTFRAGGARRLTVRLDVFNAFNAVIFNARQTTLQLNSPTDRPDHSQSSVRREGGGHDARARGQRNRAQFEPAHPVYGGFWGGHGRAADAELAAERAVCVLRSEEPPGLSPLRPFHITSNFSFLACRAEATGSTRPGRSPRPRSGSIRTNFASTGWNDTVVVAADSP